MQEYSDIATVNLLASVTKSYDLLNCLIEDYKLAYKGEKGEGDSGVDFERDQDQNDMMLMGSSGWEFK